MRRLNSTLKYYKNSQYKALGGGNRENNREVINNNLLIINY